MFLNKINKYDILLASKSPRRQQLLKEVGINFRLITKNGIKEEYPDNLVKEEIAIFLSKLKAKAFVNELKANTILITADTIVCNNNIVLGKPKDYNDAINIISSLSGKQHTVITGMCLTSLNKQKSFYSSTEVFFKNLSFEEIDYYVKNYKPYDKAGAYGIQEWIGYIGIEKIIGSYFNVVGLPIQKLYEELMKF